MLGTDRSRRVVPGSLVLLSSPFRSRTAAKAMVFSLLVYRSSGSHGERFFSLKKRIQLCGSATVNVPTGGKKKKLKHSIATTEAIADSVSPQAVATRRIATR
jgi:hypothetical protein